VSREEYPVSGAGSILISKPLKVGVGFRVCSRRLMAAAFVVAVAVVVVAVAEVLAAAVVLVVPE
jgi:hypothetical protein